MSVNFVSDYEGALANGSIAFYRPQLCALCRVVPQPHQNDGLQTLLQTHHGCQVQKLHGNRCQ